MVLNKYLAGLLTVLVVLATAFQAALIDGFTPTEAWQLVGLFVGVFVTVFVPLLKTGWAGALKVGGAVLGAIIAAIVPFVTGAWDMSAVTVVILAGLNALATQLGVNVRVDSARAIVADPAQDTNALRAIDAKAYDASQNITKQRIA